MVHFKYKELLFCIHISVLSYSQQSQACLPDIYRIFSLFPAIMQTLFMFKTMNPQQRAQLKQETEQVEKKIAQRKHETKQLEQKNAKLEQKNAKLDRKIAKLDRKIAQCALELEVLDTKREVEGYRDTNIIKLFMTKTSPLQTPKNL